jgi:hypothetical protein
MLFKKLRFNYIESLFMLCDVGLINGVNIYFI